MKIILANSAFACTRLNEFASQAFRTRGGRIGSGMGGVIEALWGFLLNQILYEVPDCDMELAWMYGHEYNDFACIRRGTDWDPVTGKGELLRVETKSMVASADESKAHFDRLQKELTKTDLLTVFLWDWVPVPSDDQKQTRVSPKILDHFIGPATEIAKLRDQLHVARGGSFIQSGKCPDKCAVKPCTHVGEPVNASGKRERLSGPASARVSQSVSYAANFGGLVRMLKCSSSNARVVFRKLCRESDAAWSYIRFIFRNLPDEEENQYSVAEWRKVAAALGMTDLPQDKREIAMRIRASGEQYPELLRSQI